MPSKTLQDFLGSQAFIDDEYINFTILEVGKLVDPSFAPDANGNYSPEQIVTTLIAYWFNTNYSDSATNNRLSQDKTIPLVSNSETARRSLVTRGDETQVKHDFSFSVYTKDNSEFNPDNLVQSDATTS